jgi:hypothetical protein
MSAQSSHLKFQYEEYYERLDLLIADIIRTEIKLLRTREQIRDPNVLKRKVKAVSNSTFIYLLRPNLFVPQLFIIVNFICSLTRNSGTF